MKAMTAEGGNPYITTPGLLRTQRRAQKKLAAMKTFDEHLAGPCVDGGSRTERWGAMCIPCDEPCFWHWRYKYSDRDKGFASDNKSDMRTYEKWENRRRREWNAEHG